MRRHAPWFYVIVVILVQACSLWTCPFSQPLPQSAPETPRPTRTPPQIDFPTNTPSPSVTETRQLPGPIAGDDPSLGPVDAPVTMVVFSDFNCSFCRRFHQETLPVLLDMYPDELRFVYRDFPIVGGGEVGYAAAQAANCAGEQEAYWEYNEALYSGAYNLNLDGYELIAEQLGLDSAALLQCLDSDRYIGEVLHDWEYGRIMGVSATPTFFINDVPLIGLQPLDVFMQVIDAELGR